MNWNTSSSLKRAVIVSLFVVPVISHAQSPSRTSPIAALREEQPTGPIDGNNVTFSLSTIPSSDEALKCFINGVQQHQGEDFRVTGQVLTFSRSKVPRPGDLVSVFYRSGSNANADHRSASLATTPLVQTDSVAKALHDQVALLLITAPPSAIAGDPAATLLGAIDSSRAGGAPPPSSRALSLLKSRVTQALGGATKSGSAVRSQPSGPGYAPDKSEVSEDGMLDRTSRPTRIITPEAAESRSVAEPASVRDLKALLQERAATVTSQQGK